MPPSLGRRVLRWLTVGLLSLLLLFVVALAVIYLLAERKLRHRYAVPEDSVSVPTDPAATLEGLRLARLRGCSGGCHGERIEGSMFVDDFLLARLAAPNLTASVRQYSDRELAAIIRHGIRPDGRSVIGMPSEMFRPLNDEDLGRIIGYLKRVPPMEGPGREARIGPMGRLGLVLGMYRPAAELVKEAEAIAPSFPPPGDSTAPGAYLARTVCTECHGLDLRGEPDGPPDLRIAAGYSLEAFAQLLRTGQALGGRELRLMSGVARERFAHFTDQEIRDLYGYLIARAALTAPSAGTN